ncbi:PGPGW domain-containing protein [Kineosporia rhizophila]|uniref:PGPGW domain-containing protein n=1 Tax=Kineosporia TaxID=49184 RepID=UPI001E64747B|nr:MULTISPECIES: PGPGW domain-containing protein [Kineosporia]MCE0534073.1 PGPGW domain-containing protein [Kineosporia rhizophila]
MRVPGTNALKSLALQVVGWALVLAGIAALVLPGPGLLALFAGLAVLATQYEWAERRLEPVKKAALRTAADSVAAPWRIAMSVLGVLSLMAIGIVWGVGTPVPSWWPIDDEWWLKGGWGVGASLIVSALIAAATIVYSYLNFREIRHEEAVEEAQEEAEERRRSQQSGR